MGGRQRETGMDRFLTPCRVVYTIARFVVPDEFSHKTSPYP